MRKLKQAVLYEYTTKLKAMGIFYTIQYAIVALIFVMLSMFVSSEKIGSNTPEVCAVVFVSVLGVLGYHEDFKSLIQNGYTRKYIFLATICTFFLMCSTMALIDTAIVNGLYHLTNENYFTLYGFLYGYHTPVINWLWLTGLYFTFCSLFYLGTLIVNKLGKMAALTLGIAVGGLILLIVALFRFVLSAQTIAAFVEFLMHAMGFMSNGSINLMLPLLTFIVIGAVLSISSYAIVRRTELK